MSERRYVTQHGDDIMGIDPSNSIYPFDEVLDAQGIVDNNGGVVHALVPLDELEAMERERAEMLEALKKTLEWFREENILEPQELSSVVIERMDKAIARAEGTRE